VFVVAWVKFGARTPPAQWETFPENSQAQKRKAASPGRQNKWFLSSVRLPQRFSARQARRPTNPQHQLTPHGSIFKNSFSSNNPTSTFPGEGSSGDFQVSNPNVIAVRGLNDVEHDVEEVSGGAVNGGFNQRRKPSKASRRSVLDSVGASRTRITSSIRAVWLNGSATWNRKKSFGAL
jgi:hypothetical protein